MLCFTAGGFHIGVRRILVQCPHPSRRTFVTALFTLGNCKIYQ